MCVYKMRDGRTINCDDAKTHTRSTRLLDIEERQSKETQRHKSITETINNMKLHGFFKKKKDTHKEQGFRKSRRPQFGLSVEVCQRKTKSSRKEGGRGGGGGKEGRVSSGEGW